VTSFRVARTPPLLRTAASQPRRPAEASAHTEGTLWWPWQACMGFVSLDVPLPGTLSGSGVCVGCLAVPLSLCSLAGCVPLSLHTHLCDCVRLIACLSG
jgi:hypothetical protein